MAKHQKYVNALFLFAGALVWFVARHYVVVLIGYFQLGRSLGGAADVMEHGLPLILGVLTFWLLRTNKAGYQFTGDALGELIRVSWPSSRDVRVGTIVVIVTVLTSGVILGGLDKILAEGVRLLLFWF